MIEIINGWLNLTFNDYYKICYSYLGEEMELIIHHSPNTPNKHFIKVLYNYFENLSLGELVYITDSKLVFRTPQYPGTIKIIAMDNQIIHTELISI